MSTVRDLMAFLGLDLNEFESGLDSAEDRVSGFQRVTGNLAAVGGGILAGGFAIAGAAAGGLAWALGQGAQEAMEHEDISVQLNNTLRNTGEITGVTRSLLDELSASMSRNTKFNEEEVMSAEDVLATFRNINADAFPQALSLSADLATKLGTDLPNASRILGQTLNDPSAGLRRLRAAGVALTDEQQEMIDQMVATGDVAGAGQMVMDALQQSIGGAAEAAGSTGSGQFAIMKNQFMEILESVSSGLLPALTSLGSTINEYIARPETQAIIQAIGAEIGNFANIAIAFLPQAVTWIQNAFGWLGENQGVIVAVLAAIGVAIAAFVYTTVIPAAISVITAIAPVIAIMLIVAGVAYLIYQAWTNNWGGIRDMIMNFWNNNLKPVFDALVAWLQVAIPAALQFLSNLWFNVLLPAITAVWAFLSTYIFPIFAAVADVIGAVLGLAIKVVFGYIQNVVIPVWKAIFQWINDKIIPVVLILAKWLGEKLQPAFDAIKSVIKWVVDRLHELADAISNLELPDWLTPGSPTPFELGLWGIQKALASIDRMDMPDAFDFSLQGSQVGAAGLAPAGSQAGSNVFTQGGAPAFSFFGNVTFQVPNKVTQEQLINIMRPS